ncbi:retrovirus-related pol polyprotein from transposon TNT 1-94 [Tanacetum coccineum]
MTEDRKQNRNKLKSWKIGDIKGKEVNMTVGDSDDALICCVENTVEDSIMDFGASFHANYCKEELERFKLRSGKTKTASIGQLDEEGYHVGFGDQQWKVTKGSLVVARGNKCGSLYIVEVHLEGIDAIIDGSGSAALYLLLLAKWFGEAEEAFFHNVREDKETTSMSCGSLVSAERLSRTFRAESTGLRAEAPNMLWADSVSTTYLIYHIPYVSIGLRIPEEEWRGKDTSLAHLKVFGCDSFVKGKMFGRQAIEMLIRRQWLQMKCDTASGYRRVTGYHNAEISHYGLDYMSPENDSIVAEHGLSSEINQSLDGASSMRGGFQDSTGTKIHQRVQAPVYVLYISNLFANWTENEPDVFLVIISAGKKAIQRLWMFKVKEEQNGRKRYKARLVVKGFQQKRGVDYNEIFSPVVKMT